MTKYKVILQNGSVEFLDEQEASIYSATNNGIRVETIEETEPVPVLPNRETAMWRIRAMMQVMGLTAQVDTLLTNLPEPEKTIANIAWNYGNTCEMQSATVKYLQAGLTLTDEQVVGIFDSADAINI